MALSRRRCLKPQNKARHDAKERDADAGERRTGGAAARARVVLQHDAAVAPTNPAVLRGGWGGKGAKRPGPVAACRWAPLFIGSGPLEPWSFGGWAENREAGVHWCRGALSIRAPYREIMQGFWV